METWFCIFFSRIFQIHGGGFVSGRATESAWNLVRLTGHVVFAPQYRLGVFGFFSSRDRRESGDLPNLGLADQKRALVWVSANAARFGGSAEKVLIWGCSAGGASVAALLVDPSVFGLYSAAAMESPGGHQGWMGDATRANDDFTEPRLNVENSQQLAARLGCEQGESATDETECLRALETDALFDASRETRFAPSLGDSVFPLGLINSGRWNRGVPVIVGGQSCESCNDAARLLGPVRDDVSDAEFRDALRAAGFDEASGVSVSELLRWYAQRIAAEGRWRTLARILSDSGHACSTSLHAEALAATSAARVYRYYFAYVSNTSAVPGATHGADESWILYDTDDGYSEGELALSLDMALWWASLNERGGDPNSRAADGAPVWPAFDSEQRDAMFMGVPLDPRPRAGSSPDVVRAECEHWKPFMGWHLHSRGAARAIRT